MSALDPRIDAYIEKSADFAKPILNHIRELVHSACSEVEETMKWGFPHFMYKGILCNMASFKSHCAVGFWKGSLIFDSIPGVRKKKGAAMGQLGRITTIADLPDRRTFMRCVIEAVRLNESGIKVPAKKRKPVKEELVVPPDLMACLKANTKALATFSRFSYSHRKEYVQWINAAKREKTREKRLKTAIEWMAAGKARDWKYTNC